jgi:hypothetical protein
MRRKNWCLVKLMGQYWLAAGVPRPVFLVAVVLIRWGQFSPAVHCSLGFPPMADEWLCDAASVPDAEQLLHFEWCLVEQPGTLGPGLPAKLGWYWMALAPHLVDQREVAASPLLDQREVAAPPPADQRIVAAPPLADQRMVAAPPLVDQRVAAAPPFAGGKMTVALSHLG